MAFVFFVLCWGWHTFCKKSTFCVFNDQEFRILIQVYFNHSGCFNLTKIPLHRMLFLRVSWRRGGSGGKAGGSWVRRGGGLMEVKDMIRISFYNWCAFIPRFRSTVFCLFFLHVSLSGWQMWIVVRGVWCTGTALHTDHRQHKWKSLSMRNINIVICGKFE